MMCRKQPTSLSFVECANLLAFFLKITLIKGRARKFSAAKMKKVTVKPARSDMKPVKANPIPVPIFATAIRIENLVAAILPSVMRMEMAK